MLVLTSCFGKDEGGCFEADDWGYPKVEVPASSKGIKSKLGDDAITGELSRQTARAIDSGYIIISASQVPLVFTISSRGSRNNYWVSHWGNIDKQVPDRECKYAKGFSVLDLRDVNSLSRRVPDYQKYYDQTDQRMFALKFSRDTQPNPDQIRRDYYNNPNQQPAANAYSADMYSDSVQPCIYKNGVGLYVGLAHEQVDSRGNPNGVWNEENVYVAKHIPDYNLANSGSSPSSDYPNIDITGQDLLSMSSYNMKRRLGLDSFLIDGTAQNKISTNARDRDRLYFKIMDRYYDDNAGGYIVNLKSGVRNPNPGPLESLTNLFTKEITNLMRFMYNSLSSTQSYISIVRAALVLYIVFYGFAFVMGMIDKPQKDAFVRLFRISIISVLLSPTSWNFFYNNFFVAFIDGVAGISSMLINPMGNYDPNNPWFAMDELVKNFYSAPTSAKILSTLFTNDAGFIFILVLYTIFIIFLISLFKAVIIYLTGLIFIAILIIIAPIIILFLLFNRTKIIFDEWVKQFFCYGLQQIILFAALGMFATMIFMFIQKTIGYTVCWQTWLDFRFFKFGFWMPEISSLKDYIFIDHDYDGIKTWVERYVDLPYFDLINDAEKIAKYLPSSGTVPRNFISFTDILTLILAIFLLKALLKFIATLVEILQAMNPAESTNFLRGGKTGGASNVMRTASALAFGSAGSGKDFAKDASNPLSKNFYGATGRDGGILGSVSRSIYGTAKGAKDGASFSVKQIKNLGTDIFGKDKIQGGNASKAIDAINKKRPGAIDMGAVTAAASTDLTVNPKSTLDLNTSLSGNRELFSSEIKSITQMLAEDARKTLHNDKVSRIGTAQRKSNKELNKEKMHGRSYFKIGKDKAEFTNFAHDATKKWDKFDELDRSKLSITSPIKSLSAIGKAARGKVAKTISKSEYLKQIAKEGEDRGLIKGTLKGEMLRSTKAKMDKIKSDYAVKLDKEHAHLAKTDAVKQQIMEKQRLFNEALDKVYEEQQGILKQQLQQQRDKIEARKNSSLAEGAYGKMTVGELRVSMHKIMHDARKDGGDKEAREIVALMEIINQEKLYQEKDPRYSAKNPDKNEVLIDPRVKMAMDLYLKGNLSKNDRKELKKILTTMAYCSVTAEPGKDRTKEFKQILEKQSTMVKNRMNIDGDIPDPETAWDKFSKAATRAALDVLKEAAKPIELSSTRDSVDPNLVKKPEEPKKALPEKPLEVKKPEEARAVLPQQPLEVKKPEEAIAALSEKAPEAQKPEKQPEEARAVLPQQPLEILAQKPEEPRKDPEILSPQGSDGVLVRPKEGEKDETVVNVFAKKEEKLSAVEEMMDPKLLEAMKKMEEFEKRQEKLAKIFEQSGEENKSSSASREGDAQPKKPESSSELQAEKPVGPKPAVKPEGGDS